MALEKNCRDIPIHNICSWLGPRRSAALPTFYNLFKGHDYVSSFRGIGPKTAWKVWEELPEITDTLLRMEENPCEVTIDSPDMKSIEKFVCRMYAKNSSIEQVNLLRQKMFTVGLKQLDAIPPTLNALYQHVRRALLLVHLHGHFALKTPLPLKIQMNGVGTGTLVLGAGYHTGRIYLMSVKVVLF